MFKEGTVLVAKEDHQFNSGEKLEIGKEYFPKRCIGNFTFIIEINGVGKVFTAKEIQEYFYEKTQRVVTTQTTTTKVKALSQIDTALENYASYKAKEALNSQLAKLKAREKELISQNYGREAIEVIRLVIDELENEIKAYDVKRDAVVVDKSTIDRLENEIKKIK